MWKNSLKNVESDNNKILYETLIDFLQRNGTYFLNKLRTFVQNFVHNKYGNVLIAFVFAAYGYIDYTLLSVKCYVKTSYEP